MHIALENHFAVDFKLRHDAVNGVFIVSAVGRVVAIKVALLVMGGQQFCLSIDASPAVRQRQVDGWLKVKTRCFRHFAVRVNKMHRLAIKMRIKRADVVLVVVHVQLRLGGIGIA